MKKSIRVGEGIAEFFGTHDGNVKYLESLLNVQVHLQDDTLTVDGPDEKVALVDRLVSDYLQLRSEGVRFSNGDLKSIIRIISEDESQSLRGVMSASRSLVGREANPDPQDAEPEALPGCDREERHGFRHRSGRYREDLSGGQHGRSRAGRKASQSHRSDAACG